MVPGVEGGFTAFQPSGERMTFYEAALRYEAGNVPVIVVAGQEYGTGSARDWAAKVTRLLGVKAVVAESFERIHRGNLVGMGVLPCQFANGIKAADLGLVGSERFDITGLDDLAGPGQALELTVHRADGSVLEAPLVLRIDTPAEIDYARSGGIMPYMLGELVDKARLSRGK
jgi:aconitate hydratase